MSNAVSAALSAFVVVAAMAAHSGDSGRSAPVRHMTPEESAMTIPSWRNASLAVAEPAAAERGSAAGCVAAKAKAAAPCDAAIATGPAPGSKG